jgi:outer membrane protein
MNMIKNILLFFLLSASLHGSNAVSIGLILDGPSARLGLFKGEIENEIQDLLTPDWSVTFIDFVGDWSLESVKEQMEKAFHDERIKVVIALGAIGSEAAMRMKELPKPVIAPFIIDRKLQHVPNEEKETSGIKNLNYLTFPTNLLNDLSVYEGLVPFDSLGLLTDAAVVEALPKLFQDFICQAQEMGIALTIIPVKNSVEEALANIPPCLKAVYVTPLPRFTADQIEQLANGLIMRKIASFSLFGRGYVDKGILASASPDAEFDRLARRIALNVQAILLGEEAADFPTMISQEKQLTINVKTAQDLCLSLPWKALIDAIRIDEEKLCKGKKLSLVEAVELGLQMNPNLASVWKEVCAGLQDLRAAQARLRMQVEISSLARTIDHDRAVFSGGFEPQSAVYGSAKGSQMIYSNQLIGDVRVQRFLQYARCENYQTNSLDLIFEVGRAYLDVLRTQTLEKIQRNNMALTMSNLQTAKRRVQAGVARLNEVYRWESQLSDNRSSVVDAYFQTASSEVVLSRLLNQPQNRPFNLEEFTENQSYWFMKKEWLEKQLNSPRDLELFTKFSVKQGFFYSPEIRELQDRICAQAEVLGIATRAIWVPDFFVIGEMRDRFCSGGAGRMTAIAGLNTTEWLFGINMNFQLYTGGQQVAARRKACQDLLRLKYLYLDLVNRIEGDIRVNINRASASFAAINLAKIAAQAASNNLQLILEGYAQGTVNILDLLDAQNQALNNDLLVVNAIYDFLTDSLSVMRSVGRFDFLMPMEDQMKRKRDLENFMQEGKNVCAAQ